MQELEEIVKILIGNIVESQEEVDEKIYTILRECKNPTLKPFLNIEHIKKHQNKQITLKLCQKTHCIECLNIILDSNVCNHGKKITAFEKTQISCLMQFIEHGDGDRRKNFKCNICCGNFTYDDIKGKYCECQECFKCIIENYEQFIISCKICKRNFEPEEMKQISYEAGQRVDLVKICPICKLAIYADAFSDDVCFVCSEFLGEGNWI
ncbi:hypothetical protein SteCoe_29021 [Stentor coeruleus]|uniref:Uncharacterized protein n=1 Tax=Stentor coeruleus TaxID=5963 RepID=A0A1R2B786_9CILI|nr:hypothetical protein SteCoe_29021 [Stentor coeruleus]